MKKLLFFAMGFIAMSMAASCTSNKTAETTENDSIAAVVDSAVQVDSVELAADTVQAAE